MLKDFFNKSGPKTKDEEEFAAKPQAHRPEGEAMTAHDFGETYAPYEPVSPNINTNPDPGELSPIEEEPANFWSENMKEDTVSTEPEESAEGYYDENGNFIYYGSENDPNGYYNESGEYIYYGSENDTYGYYDENGEYVYYETDGEGAGYGNEGAYAYGAGAGAQSAHAKATSDMEPQKEKSYSVIAEETTVMGNIMTSGHIDIVGEVLGNVEAGGNIAVLGSVSGNVSSEKMGLDNCRINGNLKASVGIVASVTSTIIGNVRTKNLLLDGKLKGNINADNVVVFRKNAYFLGDVQTGQLAIEMGAIFNGNIKMLTGGDPDTPFYEPL